MPMDARVPGNLWRSGSTLLTFFVGRRRGCLLPTVGGRARVDFGRKPSSSRRARLLLESSDPWQESIAWNGRDTHETDGICQKGNFHTLEIRHEIESQVRLNLKLRRQAEATFSLPCARCGEKVEWSYGTR